MLDSEQEWHSAMQTIDFSIFTHTIDRAGPMEVYQLDGMEQYIICIRGDKADAAELLGLPVLLFDVKEANLDNVLKKGVDRCGGIIVRRGTASRRHVQQSWRRSLVNDPLGLRVR